MASAAETACTRQSDDECVICRESFSSYKQLECGHKFCVWCLQRLGKDKQTGQRLQCPLCRAEFDIPLGGFDQLQDSSSVHDNTTTTTASLTVERHPGGDERCEEAESKLEKCDTKTGEDELGKFVCSLHPNKAVSIYCNDCQLACCESCFIRQHNGHRFSDIVEVWEALRAQLVFDSELVEGRQAEITARLGQIDAWTIDVCDNYATVRRHISEEAARLKADIDSEVEELGRMLEVENSREMERIKTAKCDIEMLLSQVGSFVERCSDVTHSAESCDVARVFKDLHTTAESLVKVPLDNLQTRVKARFRPSVFKSLLPRDRVNTLVGSLAFGDVTDRRSDVTNPLTWDRLSSTVSELEQCLKQSKERETLLLERLKEVETQLKKQQRLVLKQAKIASIGAPKGTNAVRGLAILNNELYVLRFGRKSSVITAYDIDKYCLLRRLEINGLRDVTDMTSCARNWCLYILDSCEDTIHRVEPNPNGTGSDSCWSVGDKPWGVSVTTTFSVLVTCFLKQKLKEFTTRGVTLRTISLQPDAEYPWRAIQLSAPPQQYAVCHGVAPDRRIIVIAADGSTTTTFRLASTVTGTIVGSAVSQESTDCPVYMCVDNDGFLLVLDTANKKVTLLDSKLVGIRDMVGSADGLKDARRVFWDSNTARLYVGEGNGSVNVFEFK